MLIFLFLITRNDLNYYSYMPDRILIVLYERVGEFSSFGQLRLWQMTLDFFIKKC